MALALMDKDEGIAKQQQQQQLKKGHWTPEEDLVLKRYIETHGEGKWTTVSKRSGLMRGGKSCRMRWMNYLRPNLKHGNMSQQEEDLIIRMHKLVGNRWALIAGRIHGRTDNEIKNYWNTYLSKRNSSSSGGNDHHQNTSYNNNNNNNNFINESKRRKVSAQLEPVMVSSSTTTTNNTDDQSACNSLMASTITSESTLMEGSSSNNDQMQIFNGGSAVNNLKNNKTMGPELIDSNKSNCQFYYEDTVYCEDEEPFSPALMNCMIESLGDHQIGVDSWIAAASGLPPPPLYLMEESCYPVDHLL